MKVKLSLRLTKYHTMKTYRGESRAPHILNFGSRWRSVISCFIPGVIIPPHPVDRRQMEMYIAESLVPDPSFFENETAIENLKINNSQVLIKFP
jgi:hypothetical protein